MLYKGGQMPPKTRISKEMIIDAAFKIIREKGYENLNVRSIAAELDCSTQPVLYSFKTIEEIREAVYMKADHYHTDYIMPKAADRNPLLDLGLNYVRFGYEEKNLFRFLFQSNHFNGLDVQALIDDPELGEILSIMSKSTDLDKRKTKEAFLLFFYEVHGMASLLANNAMEYNEKQSAKMLENVFDGIMALKKGR